MAARPVKEERSETPASQGNVETPTGSTPAGPPAENEKEGEKEEEDRDAPAPAQSPAKDKEKERADTPTESTAAGAATTTAESAVTPPPAPPAPGPRRCLACKTKRFGRGTSREKHFEKWKVAFSILHL